MTTEIIRDELGNRKPMVAITLDSSFVDSDGNSLAGAKVFVPMVRLDATSTVVSIPGPVEIKNEVGNPVPVEGMQTAPADRSGSIAAGGVAQQVAAASASRRGFLVQNLSTGDLWVSTIGVAVAAAGSLRIPIGGYFESPAGMAVTGAISIFGSTAGQSFTAREW